MFTIAQINIRTQGKWGTERLSVLFKITKPIYSRSETRSLVCFFVNSSSLCRINVSQRKLSQQRWNKKTVGIESKVTPKVYSVEVTHGFLGDGEPLMVCNPREEMVIKIDNTRWVFYQIFDSILGFLCTVPHRVLTATSQGKACCWKTEAETKISTEKCFLLKVLDLSS